jgi:hypothetical protein
MSHLSKTRSPPRRILAVVTTSQITEMRGSRGWCGHWRGPGSKKVAPRQYCLGATLRCVSWSSRQCKSSIET